LPSSFPLNFLSSFLAIWNEVDMVRSRRQEIKGVIFDLDGTLIDSLGAYTEAFNRGVRIFGLEPVTAEQIARFLDEGLRLSEMLLELSPSVFEKEEKRGICENEIRRAYVELEPKSVVLKSGAKRTLQSLKDRGMKIGIVTGRRSHGERKWLEIRRLNIRRFIDAMVTGAEAPAKPSPDGVTRCIQELGLSAPECLFIGDSRIDVIAGKRAGVRTIAVHSGVAGKELLAEQGPNCILADLNSLSSYLGELQKNPGG
jgi:HAD superfamily hydrolase (TIGR01509 family)